MSLEIATGRVEAVVPPGPHGVRGFFRFLGFAGDRVGFAERFVADFPDAGRLRMLGMNLIFLTDLEALGELLLDREQRFAKDWTTQTLDVVLGNGLVTSQGARWRRQRQIIAPSLQRKHVAAYAQAMAARADQMVANLPDEGIVAVRPAMMRLTLEVVADTLFGADVGLQVSREVGAALDEALAAFEHLVYTWRFVLPKSWPQPVRKRLGRAAGRLNAIVDDLIARRRAEAASGDDLLGRLLAARDEEGAPMHEKQLRDEVVTILLAGHETTAMTLSFALWNLVRHPEACALVRAEVDAVVGARSPGAEDVPKLPFTTAVIKETLRLYPPFWIFGRQALIDCQVGRWKIGKGDQVLVVPWVMHRNPGHFPKPETFHPNRWLDGLEDRLPRHAYLPFGGGSRVCAGIHFAMMEAVIVLAVLLGRLDFAAVPGYEMKPSPAITLRPGGDLPLHVRRR